MSGFDGDLADAYRPKCIELFGGCGYDWPYVFCEADLDPALVKSVVASEEGENDGDSWVAVVMLNDGRVAFVTADCDYTGWDCQAGGEHHICDDMIDLLRGFVGEENVKRLKLRMPGPEQADTPVRLTDPDEAALLPPMPHDLDTIHARMASDDLTGPYARPPEPPRPDVERALAVIEGATKRIRAGTFRAPREVGHGNVFALDDRRPTPAITLACEAMERVTRQVDAGEPLVRLEAREVMAIHAMVEVMGEEIVALRARVAEGV